jgi:N-acetyl-gamma-glutamyl-phosphate reductase common form
MIKVKVVGAGGFGGAGMIDLILRHPHAKLHKLVDVENAGEPISKVWPHLAGYCDMVIESPDKDKPGDGESIVFMATPDRVGMSLAPAYVKAGVKVVDYSGDFRFNDARVYAGYAGRIGKDTAHLSPQLIKDSVYGLAELHRKEIAKASVVGNPGCFAVATILGLYPAVKAGAVDITSVVSDAKTGISGAGKKPAPGFHYPMRYDNMNAYKIAKHQHCYEIEHELTSAAGSKVNVAYHAGGPGLPRHHGVLLRAARCGLGGRGEADATLQGRLSGRAVRARRRPRGLRGEHRRPRDQPGENLGQRGPRDGTDDRRQPHRQPDEGPGLERRAEHEYPVRPRRDRGAHAARAVPVS